MLYQVKYQLSVVVEADAENEAGMKARKDVIAHTNNDWWNQHLLNIEVSKLGSLVSDKGEGAAP